MAIEIFFPQCTHLSEALQLMIVPHLIKNERRARNYRVTICITDPKAPIYAPRLPVIFRTSRFLRTEAINFCMRGVKWIS